MRHMELPGQGKHRLYKLREGVIKYCQTAAGEVFVVKKCLRCCALLLCISLALCAVPAAQATETVYFTAVNETVLKLFDATMPFWHNGRLYISSDMFADKELGITYYHNVVTRTATLYDAGGALQFDLEKGTSVDGNGYPMSIVAIVRGGRVFFPVESVADYFGLTFTQNAVKRGYVVRLRSADSVLNDRLFLDAATSLLEYRYEEYKKSQSVVAPPVTPVTPPDNPKPPEPPVKDERTIYLGFYAADNSGGLLDVLNRTKVPATFFFTKEQLVSDPAFVRRLVVSGYGIGLAADCAQESDAAEQLRSANALLWRLTGTKTRLCVLENAASTDRESAAEAGYCCLQADVDFSWESLPSDAANELYREIHRQEGDAVTVWLADGVVPTGLQAFLNLADSNGDQLAALTESILNS